MKRREYIYEQFLVALSVNRIDSKLLVIMTISQQAPFHGGGA